MRPGTSVENQPDIVLGGIKMFSNGTLTHGFLQGTSFTDLIFSKTRVGMGFASNMPITPFSDHVMVINKVIPWEEVLFITAWREIAVMQDKDA